MWQGGNWKFFFGLEIFRGVLKKILKKPRELKKFSKQVEVLIPRGQLLSIP